MKRELTEFDPNYEHDKEAFMKMLNKNLTLGYLIELNNLCWGYTKTTFLGKRANKTDNPDIQRCFLCNLHVENRSEIYVNCEKQIN